MPSLGKRASMADFSTAELAALASSSSNASSLGERLPGEARDPLVVLPCIRGEAGVHTPRGLTRKETRRCELERYAVQLGQSLQGGGGAVAPAAKRIEEIGDPHIRTRCRTICGGE
jgi:hypothetical protein